MGFNSLDDFIAETTAAGKFNRADWNKNYLPTTAAVAGTWYSLLGGAGNPAASTLPGAGTNLSLQPGYHDVTPGGGGFPHGGNVLPDTKHILNVSSFSAAPTTMPSVLMLVDVLAHYPITTTTVITAQTCINSATFTAANATDVITHAAYDIPTFSRVRLTNSGGGLPAGLAVATDYFTIRQSATTSKLASSLTNAVAGTAIDFTTDGTGTHTITPGLPRYTDGVGVQAFHMPSTVMGAGTPNLTLSYTNGAGTAGRTTPASPALPALTTAAPVGMLDASGTGAGKYGPFLPLQSADTGVRSVESITYSATRTSGVGNIMLARPLLTLPMTTVGVAAERDLLNQIPSLPRVLDGACLAWLLYAGAAVPVNSAFYGHADFGWG